MVVHSADNANSLRRIKLSVERWLEIWVMLFGIGVLGFAPLYGASSLVLLVTACTIIVFNKKKIFICPLSREEKIFLIVVFIYFSSQMLSVLYQPKGFEYQSLGRRLAAFDYVSRWLLLIPVWLMFRAYKVDWIFIGVGLAVGSIIGAVLGHHQVYNLGFGQATGASNHPIPYGELMVAADMILWLYMIRSWEMKKRLLSGFFFAASLFAFYGSLLAVTRGAWLVYGLMIAIWAAYMVTKSAKNVKYLYSPLVLFRVLVALAIFLIVCQTDHYQIMQDKTIATVAGLRDGNIDGATSLRYGNAVIAIETVKIFPFGIGMDNYALAEGALFGHAHNEFLNTAVETGIFGFLSLVALFVFAGISFFNLLRGSDETVRLFSASGLMLIASYAVFAQSQAVYSHHDTLLFFIFYFYLFLGQAFFTTGSDVSVLPKN